VVSCFVMFSALAPEPSIGGKSVTLYTVPCITPIRRYSSFALSKISKLALVGYISSAYSPLHGLFLCVISLCVRMLWRSWRGTLSSVQVPKSLSTNPFQLCHPHLVVIGKASKLSRSAYSCLIKHAFRKSKYLNTMMLMDDIQSLADI
jgi:hypothetical protein